MEKTCSITYGELLEKGFQVIDIKGIISLCPLFGPALAKPINSLLNYTALQQASKELDIDYLSEQMKYTGKLTEKQREEFEQIQIDYKASGV